MIYAWDKRLANQAKQAASAMGYLLKKAKLSRGNILILLVLSVISCAIYSNTLDVPLIYDSKIAVLGNPDIRLKEISAEGIYDAAFSGISPNRPFSNISFALNYYVHQYKVPGYHVVNILLHTITGILLFFIFKVTFSDVFNPGSPLFKKGGITLAVIIWLVHPIHTQSVTYIAERTNCLAGMFYLLTFFLYIKTRLAGSKYAKRLLFAGCVFAGVLSIGSKETAATLVFFIFLYEWYFFQDLKLVWFKKNTSKLWILAPVFTIVAGIIFLRHYEGTSTGILAGWFHDLAHIRRDDHSSRLFCALGPITRSARCLSAYAG